MCNRCENDVERSYAALIYMGFLLCPTENPGRFDVLKPKNVQFDEGNHICDDCIDEMLENGTLIDGNEEWHEMMKLIEDGIHVKFEDSFVLYP